MQAQTTTEHILELDTLIVGAGISGISAACHLVNHCPGHRFAIAEARPSIGGTWDLFRYPGIRSDTDMSTFTFSFHPWKKSQIFGNAQAIKDYLQDTIDTFSLQNHIRFERRVVSAAWSSQDARWTVKLQHGSGASETVQCQFLFMCTGYYNYETPYAPVFKNAEQFQGKLVHPQFWPADLDCAGKKILIIGSGATAITLLPALAPTAGHVTMLQRSPSYIAVRASHDPIANALRAALPLRWASKLIRAKTVLMGAYIHRMCRTQPAKAKAFFIGQVRQALAPLGPDFDFDKHFTPRYNPWEQRVCMVPDGDFFTALNSRKASIVTDEIDAFTATGVQLKSGDVLEADIIVPATGLALKILDDIRITVDGAAFDVTQSLSYKGVGYSGLPNFLATFGYTKASWTLKADLTSLYFTRLVNELKRQKKRQFMPKPIDEGTQFASWTDMSSGYFQRGMDKLAKQGPNKPWQTNQAVIPDIMALRFSKLDDGDMLFSS